MCSAVTEKAARAGGKRQRYDQPSVELSKSKPLCHMREFSGFSTSVVPCKERIFSIS